MSNDAKARAPKTAGPSPGRRLQALAYTLVTTTIVLLLALFEWATERYISQHSRIASVAIEIAIVLIAALVFRPIHRWIEARVDAAFYHRRRLALEALKRFRHELTSFSDAGQLLRRVIEAVEHHLEARGCAVYLGRETFRAERSSFDGPAADVGPGDPLLVRLLSSGEPARPALLQSAAPGTHAFGMTVAGDLVGFLVVDCRQGEYDDEETQMLGGLAQDLGLALVELDPLLRRTSARATNIPANLPPLIGRSRELGEIGAALERSRLVTITGSGGVGKTRIALECASEALASHEHGAWFVDLAPIADASLIAATILSSLNAAGGEAVDELPRLLEYLRARDALIVIDNCEQLLAAASDIVAQIRANCPHVSLLATSRELLHLEGEHVYRLGSLRPEAAVELFTARAASVVPEFDASPHVAEIRSICEQLDGIPLAVELAAVRVRALSVAEILARLDERFRLLTSSARTALPRRQTLWATIEWSYDLLAGEEQSLFQRLFAFRGSFSLAAAAAVCTQNGRCDEYHVLDVLTSLSDKSLLTVTRVPETRYRLLETIREFAGGKAAEQQARAIVSHQHAAYFASLAAAAYHEFDSRLPPGWLERLAPDIDNLRAALQWTLEGPGDRRTGAQLAADCGPIFLRLEHLAEGLRWCDAALGVESLEHATAGRIEYVASMMQNNLGQDRLALASAERAVGHYRASTDVRGSIRALSQVAQQYAKAGRFADAVAPADEAIRAARELNESRVLIGVLRRCARSLPPPEIERARQRYAEAMELARSADDRDELWRVLDWWSASEFYAGCHDRAIELAAAALTYVEGDSRLYIEINIAQYAFSAGRLDDARPHVYRAVELARDLQHPIILTLALAYASAFHADRDPQEAAVLLGYATARLRELDGSGDDEAFAMARKTVERALGDRSIDALLERGARLRQEEALALVASGLAGANDAVQRAHLGSDGVGTLLGK